jgi:hypothetical protein
MGTYGAGGALLSLEELLGWGCRRVSGKGGRLSKALLDIWWGMGRRLAFSMTCVEIQFSRKPFQFYLYVGRFKSVECEFH